MYKGSMIEQVWNIECLKENEKSTADFSEEFTRIHLISRQGTTALVASIRPRTWLHFTRVAHESSTNVAFFLSRGR